ncbi:ADP-heptose--LPS heptosyltransferase [Ferrigenium kumadai]|uniref:Lipopolysaccharide heptosyltransferase 1 n=1 Tax=Ferrigenium kumadai TaxID=1682490 RepID=A0AAN1T0U4_9PROT|nr:lipopolysaccharide heptosyltransferase I [Ferrigenium kumadai]BBJ00664.1 ADP-heptose--LPS heptosyltransferase [Ferrigenium kumadai]
MQNAPHIVLIKTSSLGDVLHNLPVVTDIRKHLPDARIDWVVEESFAALPALHPGVGHVIPVAMRRWRKSWWRSRSEIQAFCRKLQTRPYDLALDTQGLLKSALITRCVRAEHCGHAWGSAREPLASLFYDRTCAIAEDLHAVERNRQLAASVLGYTADGAPDYGIRTPDLVLPWLPDTPYAVLLHATSRDDKLWDEQNWITLGKRLHSSGLRAVLPWGSEKEKARSERLCAAIPSAVCAPRMNLNEAAALLGKARTVIGVDTGLSHLAAALDVPTVGIYTATDPGLTGLYAGSRAVNLGGKHAPPTVNAVIEKLANLGVHV